MVIAAIYIYIYASSAEVERLWSLAKHIQTNERKGRIELGVFESLIFMKVNSLYWNDNDVATADEERRVEDMN